MSDDQAEDLLAVALEDYQRRLDAGDSAGATSIDLDTELPVELRERLKGQVQCLEMLHALRSDQGASRTTTAERPEPPVPRARFQRLDELGNGGFGIVWRARDPATGRIVALKVPRPEVLASVELRQRFEQEAEAAARLDHPNIVPILEAGTDGMVPYIASAYYEGPTLAKWLSEQTGPVAPRLAAQIALALAKALMHAHERGVLHRDVKPSNVLLTRRPDSDTRGPAYEPKLMDFGLAKLGERDQSLTRTGAMLGTLKYMAPEQAAGRAKEITAATDVYGLGVVLYEMLAGAPPFSAESDWLVLREVLETQPRSVSSIRRDVPRDLAVIVQKCLNKSPAERYPSARELAEDLERFLTGRAIVARPVPLFERCVKWCRRNPAWATSAAVFLLALVGGIAFLSYSNLRISAALNAEQKARQQLAQRLYAADMRRADEALDANNLTLAKSILDRYLQPDAMATRDFAWHLLARVLPHEAKLVPRHPAAVYNLSLSPDGTRLATACADGFVRVWDRQRGELQVPPLDCDGEANEVAFSSDGRWLGAACADGLVRVWETGDWKCQHRFPTGGVVTADFADSVDSISAIAMDANGSIVTAGTAGVPNREGVITRWLPDGRLDNSLAGDGRARAFPKTKSDDYATAVAVQADGKIIAAGNWKDDQYCVSRILADGTLDPTFGDEGVVFIRPGEQGNELQAMTLQADGRIVVMGVTERGGFRDTAVLRLLDNGALDPEFAGGAIQLAKLSEFDEEPRAVAVLPDGKILVAGYACVDESSPSKRDAAFLRINADGTLDEGFGSGGQRILAVSPSYSEISTLAVLQDGRVLAAGIATFDEGQAMIALRLEADGTQDTTFGNDGVAVIDLGLPSAVARASVLQADGKLVLAGSAGEETRPAMVLARLTSDGELDPQFGSAGRVVLSLGAGAAFNSVTLTADNKIVAGGYLKCGTSEQHVNFSLARFEQDGTLDRTFSRYGARGLAFLGKTGQLVTYDCHRIQIWDLPTGESLRSALVPLSTVDAICVSPDAKQIAVLASPVAFTWSTSQLESPLREWGTGEKIKAIAYHPGGEHLFVGMGDGRVRMLSLVEEDAAPIELAGHDADNSRMLRTTRDGTLLASASNRDVLIYAIEDLSKRAAIISTSRIFDSIFAPDKDAIYLATIDGDVIRRGFSRDGIELRGDGGRKLFGSRSNIFRMAVSSDATRVACGMSDGQVAVVSVRDGRRIFEQPCTTGEIRGLRYQTKADAVIAADATGEIVQVDLDRQTSRRVIATGQSISEIALSSDDSQLAVAYKSSPRIDFYTWPEGKMLGQLKIPNPAEEIEFWGDSRLIVRQPWRLDVFDIRTRRSLGSQGQPGTSLEGLELHADQGMLVVAESTRGVSLRRLPGLEVVERIVAQESGVEQAAMSPAGNLLATLGDDRRIRLWDVATVEPLLTLDVENVGYVRTLHFSRDGRLLFFNDGSSVVVWDGSPQEAQR